MLSFYCSVIAVGMKILRDPDVSCLERGNCILHAIDEIIF